jgi:hypothetical protein
MPRRILGIVCASFAALFFAGPSAAVVADDDSASLHLTARSRPDDGPRPVETQLDWDPRETAIVICDMWNEHWCQGATRRVADMAPRMNEVVTRARNLGE